MKITSVEATPYTIPYAREFHMATGSLAGAEHVLVRVHTDEGLTGIAEAVARPMIYGESQRSIVTAIDEWLAPAIVGLDPFSVEVAAERMRSVVNNDTAKGAVDIAMHDLQGKALGVSCWQLLGAFSPTMTVTCMLSMAEPAVMAAEAAELREAQGVRSFKVKIGPDLDATIAALGAIRDAVGQDATLYVDANRSLRPEQVLRLVRMLRDIDLALFEDPTEIEDRDGRAQLARRLEMPIMADETARTVGAAGNELRSGLAGAVSVKTARTGFTGSRQVLGLAAGLHARTIMGSQGDSSLGIAAGLCFGAAHSSTARESGELDFFRQLADDIVTERPEIRDGMLRVPVEVPGIGASIDEERLQRYRIDV